MTTPQHSYRVTYSNRLSFCHWRFVENYFCLGPIELSYSGQIRSMNYVNSSVDDNDDSTHSCDIYSAKICLDLSVNSSLPTYTLSRKTTLM